MRTGKVMRQQPVQNSGASVGCYGYPLESRQRPTPSARKAANWPPRYAASTTWRGTISDEELPARALEAKMILRDSIKKTSFDAQFGLRDSMLEQLEALYVPS